MLKHSPLLYASALVLVALPTGWLARAAYQDQQATQADAQEAKDNPESGKPKADDKGQFCQQNELEEILIPFFA